jgi:thiamine-phosphate pyrophosphorylase
MNRSPFRLCLVTDRPLAGGRALVDIVSAAVRGGVSMVQLREKETPTRAFLAEARALKALLAPLGVPLLINDRVDVALACGADGVHVGQNDMPVEMVRALMPQGAIIGLSTNTVADVLRPDAQAADYLGVGPIHHQTVKLDAASPLGVAGFAALRRASARPLMVIGGVTSDNAAPLLTAGADALAVVSAIMAERDPEEAARRLDALLRAAGR